MKQICDICMYWLYVSWPFLFCGSLAITFYLRNNQDATTMLASFALIIIGLRFWQIWENYAAISGRTDKFIQKWDIKDKGI